VCSSSQGLHARPATSLKTEALIEPGRRWGSFFPDEVWLLSGMHGAGFRAESDAVMASATKFDDCFGSSTAVARMFCPTARRPGTPAAAPGQQRISVSTP